MSEQDELQDRWAALEPTAAERRRTDRRVSAWLDAHDVSLAREWASLFRVAPLPALGLITAGAFGLVTAPPVLWIVRALL